MRRANRRLKPAPTSAGRTYPPRAPGCDDVARGRTAGRISFGRPAQKGCMSEPLHVAFLGCGFITRVHSQYLKGGLSGTIVPSYASRDRGKAEEFRRQFRVGELLP